MGKSPSAWTRAGLGASWLALCLASGASLAAEASLQLVHRFSIQGAAPVRAIAFGPGGTQAYVATGSELRDYDVATAQLADTLALPAPVADMVIDTPSRTGFAALAAPAKLVIFRLQPLKVTASTALTDGSPSALLFDAATHALLVESAQAATVTKFDAATGRRLASLRMQGSLRQMAADGRGTLYVADMAHDAIDVVDEAQMKYLGAIPVTGCKDPTGLAMDQVGRRLFVGCTDGMRYVVDTDLGFTFERLPSSLRGTSRMVFAFHPFGSAGWKGAAIGASENGRLALVRMNAFVNYSAAGDYPLNGSFEAMALDQDTHQLWLALGQPSPAGRAAGPVELWTLGATAEVSK